MPLLRAKYGLVDESNIYHIRLAVKHYFAFSIVSLAFFDLLFSSVVPNNDGVAMKLPLNFEYFCAKLTEARGVQGVAGVKGVHSGFRIPLFGNPKSYAMEAMHMKRWFTVALLLSASIGAGCSQADKYAIVGTGQTKCYDNLNVITAPARGAAFYGQDAQFPGAKPSYTLSADGLTVYDNVTSLTWQRSPDTNGDGSINALDKMTWAHAKARPAVLNAVHFGGFSDWRLPSIKELYSLIEFSGADPSGPNISGNRWPFIDIGYFKFAYGDMARGERTIDSQYASSTRYVGKSVMDAGKVFGVNFADGRIKGYDLRMPGGRMEKTFFVICVRGNTSYGKNDFHDNGDGTITDRATNRMWSKSDSGSGMNWQAALAWAQARNAENYLGHNDWRLPNAKELQSIVDYTRAPETTGSPAIDPVFSCTKITNEIGQADYSFYWSSTTHASIRAGGNAVYVAFGRAAGWPTGMPGQGGGPGGPAPGGLGFGGPPPGAPGFAGPPLGGQGFGGPPGFSPLGSGSGTYHYSDVHGAGAQRSDPKTGNPAYYPHGHGPQGDVIRIFNYVRLVRGM
jgi:hypothetical protein